MNYLIIITGLAPINETTGMYIKGEYSKDINCSGSDFCNAPKWANETWGGDDIPGMNLDRPIQKDTLVVPAGE